MFQDIAYQSFYWYMRGQKPLLMVPRKVNKEESDRNEDKSLNCLKLVMKELPKYCSRKDFSNFAQKYGDAIEGNVPNGMLKLMFRDLKKDSSALINNELMERCFKYWLSKGDMNLWPNLGAANTGTKSFQYTRRSN